MAVDNAVADFARNVGMAHILCVILGAPIVDKVTYTAAFSVLFCLLGGKPFTLFFRPSASRCAEAERQRESEVLGTALREETILSSFLREFRGFTVSEVRTVIFGVFSLLGGLLALLDWDLWWQYWPMPSSVLLLVAALVFRFAVRRSVDGNGVRRQRHHQHELAVKVE